MNARITTMTWVLSFLAVGLSFAETRYVWKDNPNAPVPPYTSGWAGAATNIQDAVDACADGDVVKVTNGVYNVGGRVAPGDTTLNTRLVVTNAVTVISVNGPAATRVVGQPHSSMTYDGLGDGAVRCVYLANGAVLSGFTVTNGFTRYTTSSAANHYYGGGIRCESEAATVTNCVIAGNWAAMRGGGIFQGTVVDCQVLSNTVRASSASAGGGGIYGAVVRRCLVEANQTVGSSTDGGGTYACTVEGCVLRGNSSGRNGGGAYLSTLISSTVESNSAAQQGGGAHSPMVVTNSLVRWNTAGRSGGGLYKGAVTGSMIASNMVTTANYYGGGYCGDNASADWLADCEIVGNSAITYGGGVCNAVLSNCVVRANRAVGGSATSGSGGGYYASSATGYQAINTRFLDNEANYRGGGAYQGRFFGCVFSGNTAAQAGAFYGGSSSYVLFNCSVMGNSATTQYGGTYNGTISNSVVYANEAPSSANYSGGTFRHSCADPLPTGTGNINTHPLVSGYRDPHLLPGSPLIAAGATNPWMTDATDLDGDARLSNGVVDIGADQFTGATLDGPLFVAVSTATNVCAVGWPHTFMAEASGKVKGLSWNFGEGGAAGTVNPVHHVFSTPGVYTVTATVSNDTHTASGACTVTVIDPVVYVSPSGGHVHPFDTWAKAATNLQDAVDAVVLAGGRVLATNGVYAAGERVATGQTAANRLVLDKAVRVESVNGPAFTTIDGRWNSEAAPLGAAAIRGVYVGGEAVLCGFTVSNGATAAASNVDNGRGGGIFLAAGGVATNCVVTGCRAWSGGGAASATGAAGELRGCVLTGNEALQVGLGMGLGGGAANLALTGCTIVSNKAYQGGGAYDGVLEGCEVASNTAGYQGGGVYYGTLSRCRVRDNAAGSPSSGVGGGVMDATLTSCLISGNTARQGGGVYGLSASKGMFNCTVVGNAATVTGTTPGGGGFYGNGTSYPVRNCIVYYNTSTGLAPNLYQGTVTYSCASPLPSGAGNTDAAPMLADFSNGRLLPGSPCIGAGLYEAWMADAQDLDGEPRADGNSVDMGADQLDEAGLTGPLAVSIIGPAWPFFPGTNYTFVAAVEGAATTLHWDFGDGTAATQTPLVEHAWAEGDYVLRLTVSNATHRAEATLLVGVAPDTRYVSPSGSHTPPFRSWADAATNLQDAADAVMAGGRIQVAAGVYAVGGRAAGNAETLINRLLVPASVAVTAVDGPDATFIVGAVSTSAVTNGLGEGAVRGVYLSTGAAINGFTVMGGRTRWTTTGTEGDYAGGGIYCADGSCAVTDCVVTNCAAAARGGGIYRGTIRNCTIEGNGVYSSGNSLGWGGGASHASLGNCIVRANEARSSGGGAYLDMAAADTLFDGNRSVSGSGGGCCMYTSGTELLRCTVVNNNAAAGYGGGAYGAAATDCLFTNNAAVRGGGVYNSTDTVSIRRCRIENNRAGESGGGGYRSRYYQCRIIGNTSGTYGGGVCYGVLYSSVVSGNRAANNGGGTYFSTLECCTVVDNEAAYGGGSYLGTAYFSIMRYNRAPAGPQYYQTESYGCCTEPFEQSVTYGPILAAPQLSGLRNPHLLAGSPCIDSGDYRGWMQSVDGLDIDGETRYVIGDYDVGVDERHAAGLSGALSVALSVAQTTIGPHYAPEFWAEATGLVGEMRWNFGDGTSLTNQNPVSHSFAGPGVYTVVVSVSNATHTASATQAVTVVSGDVYASPSGGHVPPFASWANAATNIQDAVDTAVWGGTVWLANGTYSRGGRPAAGLVQTNRVCLEKAVVVRGANGPAAVIIAGAWHAPGVAANGPAAVRGVYLGHPQARLVGVTVSGGATGDDEDDGGGVYCAETSAGGSNCVVTACTAYDEGGGAWGGTWSGSTLGTNGAGWGGGAARSSLDKCQLTGNTAENDGGGSYECALVDCEVTDNAALDGDGGGLSYGSAVRCVFSGNAAGDDGGGSYEGDLANCLLLNNTAAYGGGATYGSLDSCTVADNVATDSGGGLYGGSALNSIVWSNQAPSDPEWSGAFFRYCLTAPLPSGDADQGGNLTGNPAFASPSAGNYRLTAASPCVNAGETDGYASWEGSTDLDGRARLLGAAPDMGAYEYVSQAGQAALGTPIDWLDDYYAGPDWNAAELDDSDGDGFPAWMEYVALTNPKDGTSFFRIDSLAASGGDIVIAVVTASGRVYTLQRTTGLNPALWLDVGVSMAGNGGLKTFVMPATGSPVYYRIRVALP